MQPWYKIKDIAAIDSPSIALYKIHLDYNLQKMVAMVNGRISMLMPHVKTNKMPEVVARMIALGIKNFKASTISEAEIAARVGAHSVLIAHQLVGPKVERLCKLAKHYSKTKFSTLIDDNKVTAHLNTIAKEHYVDIGIYIDINNGMNRSGIEPGPGLDNLVAQLSSYSSLHFKGLHVYDGHLRTPNFKDRKQYIETALLPIETLFHELQQNYPNLQLICGGTPSFTSHLTESDRITSPGTCVLWDWGYEEKLQEQDFKFAALVITRVISKPTKGIVTIDLGHKSIAAENPIDKRVKFLNLKDYKLISQSEEHGVLTVDNWDEINIGDVLYGIPYHICPTINLHDKVSVIADGKLVDYWEISARRRQLNY